MHAKTEISLTNWMCGLCSALLLALPATGASGADMGITGYLVGDRGGSVVYTSRGECVHTSSWKPSLAVPGCDNYVEKMEPTSAAPVQVAVAEPKRLEMVTLDARTLFAFDKAELRPESRQVLDEMAQRLNDYPEITRVVISGYTDRIGAEAYNKELSRRRAQSVADYLSERTDVRRTGIEVRAMGEAEPLVECRQTGSFKALVECLQPNRRVTVDISAMR
ncbi:MAG: OmpA family protein [Gammaproteobacteria bacterium]|jgi:OOP family OmpA-OmpF porin